MKRLFLVLAIMGLFAQNTYAQRGSAKKEKTAVLKQEKGGKKTAEDRAKKVTDALNEEITLTKEQYSVIYKNNVAIIKSKMARKEAWKTAKTSISSVLTDTQKEQFKEHPKLSAEDKAEMRSSKMNEALGLDRGQYSKVVNLNKELFSEVEALKAKRESTTEKREMMSLKGEGKKIRENYRKQLSEVLTKEQLTKAQDIIGKNAEPSAIERAETMTNVLNKKISLNAKQNSHVMRAYTTMFEEADKQDEIRRNSKEAIAAQLTPEQAEKLKKKAKNRGKKK